ncbi:uncharacterized protein LOC121881927 [Thunnus maccoyii]|uniref:uncharacterized protein LOC121881927 n=1 Tax=Thunnus maccoyii TaxID=8240 RepID=UPI001C4AF82B|nr:uncharacterized protein LOC121881927 [Thunnus maccoyii]
MEAALRCITSANPSAWSSQLPWVEYAHNTLPNASSGMTPFLCSLGYQPPLFPTQEVDIVVPSVQAHMRRCHRTCTWACTALLHATTRARAQADRHCTPAPNYSPGQKSPVAPSAGSSPSPAYRRPPGVHDRRLRSYKDLSLTPALSPVLLPRRLSLSLDLAPRSIPYTQPHAQPKPPGSPATGPDLGPSLPVFSALQINPFPTPLAASCLGVLLVGSLA